MPLQVFIIGDYSGIGVQGAAYRYQTSSYGTSMILITQELMYIVNGIYSGKTALSIILWICGTMLLTCTAIFTSINVASSRSDFYRSILYGLVASCAIYLASCIAQYGILFHGPAGISLPVGILFILIWIVVLIKIPELLTDAEPRTAKY